MSIPPTQLQSYLAENLPAYLEFLRQMVTINSFTANSEGVNHLGDLIAERFASLGFVAQRVPSVNPAYGQHLVLTRQGSQEQWVGCVSHLDTVFPPEEELRNQFAWRSEGERIYGPGTIDIKGGTAMIYAVLDAIYRLAPERFEEVSWMVLLDASEEADGHDFGELCRHKLGNARACLIFESGHLSPTTQQLKIVTARKGMAVFQIAAYGKASHAGSAHPQGANAIVQLAEVVQKIAGFTDYERELTFNVGTINGGTVVNRVPHYATALVEMRTFDAQLYAQAIEQMLALDGYASVSSQDGFACQVSVEIDRHTAAWPPNAGTNQLFTIWTTAAQQLGYTTISEQRGGLSDGNHTWSTVPTLDGLGPAGANMHCSEQSPDGSKEQEYLFVPSFIPKAMINVLAILQLIATHEIA